MVGGQGVWLERTNPNCSLNFSRFALSASRMSFRLTVYCSATYRDLRMSTKKVYHTHSQQLSLVNTVTSFTANFELYKESDVWAAIQRVVRGRQTHYEMTFDFDIL